MAFPYQDKVIKLYEQSCSFAETCLRKLFVWYFELQLIFINRTSCRHLEYDWLTSKTKQVLWRQIYWI